MYGFRSRSAFLVLVVVLSSMVFVSAAVAEDSTPYAAPSLAQPPAQNPAQLAGGRDLIKNGSFETGDFSEEALKPYETRMRGGVGIWYEFIRLYYKLLPLFTHFIQSKDHRLEVLRLLQGEVYDRKDVPVLDAMRKYIEAVEKSDSHLLKSRLTNISID